VEATGTTTTVTLGTATASDLVDGSVLVSNNAPATFPVGTTTVTYTATDVAGNTATATQAVTITDTTAPIISPPLDLTVEATGTTTTVTLGTATASDLVDGSVLVSNDAPATFPVGTTTVTYTATDVAGNTATATQAVTITDTTAPIISPPLDLTVEATGTTTTVTLGTATASDLVDGSVLVSNNAPATFPVGTTTVTYTATDVAGNTATATQAVTITDTTAPIISPPLDLTVEATGTTTTVTLGTATASDLVDGSVLVSNDAPATFPVGITTVTYTATDVAGNSATEVTQSVTITDTTPPTITVPADVNLDSNDGNPVGGSIGVATANDLVNGSVTVTNDAPALFPIGATTVTYTASDLLGNIATETQTVTVTIVYIQAPVVAATPSFTLTTVKGFQFDWSDVSDASFYRLLENPDGASGFTQLGTDILPSTQTITEIVALYRRLNAQYILQSCNTIGCTDSSTLNVTGTLINSIGRLTHSNRGGGDRMGWTVRLSADTNTLAVGAPGEDNSASGINPSGNNNSALQSGAVYIFTRNQTNWTQQAFIKASNAEAGDEFGYSIDLSDDGNTLVVGAQLEDSSATNINGNQTDNSATDSGAAYVFTRSGSTWTQQAYLKASNTDIDDEFGTFIELSSEGNTLAISAIFEDSNATDINGDAGNNSASNSGATYIFTRSGSTWTQQAYLKASNTGAADHFGQSLSLSTDANTLAASADDEDTSGTNTGAVYTFTRSGSTWLPQAFIKHDTPLRSYEYFGQSISLSGDGTRLAVGSPGNDSGATGINGDPADTSANASGSAYIFTFDGSSWTQETFIKASNTDTSDSFGYSVTLSSDGNTLAVGATREDSNATGLNGNEADNSTSIAGAVYVFKRITGSWEQQAYVKSTVIDNNAYFGVSMHLSPNGDTLSIGARGENGGGAVYLY
jgi:hypothetical protein